MTEMDHTNGRNDHNAACWCCGEPAPIRGDGDPWEGRLDGYCESCATTRCDTTDSTCAVKNRVAASLIQAAENAERLLSDLTNAPIASGTMRANIIIARNNLRDALRAVGSRHQPDGVHTIPVPQGWSPEQAWEAIRRGDELTDPEPSWVNVRVVAGKFVEVCDAD